jgi:nicotinamidase-related amidase
VDRPPVGSGYAIGNEYVESSRPRVRSLRPNKRLKLTGPPSWFSELERPCRSGGANGTRISSRKPATSLSRSTGPKSGFAYTELDLQLKQHGVEKVILIGLVANTCVESTGRFAMELGYHVALVIDI